MFQVPQKAEQEHARQLIYLATLKKVIRKIESCG
jgi:hypothetical protein